MPTKLFRASLGLDTKTKLDLFEELYDKHVDKVRGIVFRIARPNDLDDLVQLTFLKVWKSFGFFQKRSRSSTWIHRIAVNTALDEVRKQSAQKRDAVEVNDLDTAEVAASTEDVLARRQLADLALSQLDDETRALVVLRIFEDIPERDCADLFEVSVGTIKSRMARAKEKMAQTLEKGGVKNEQE